MNRGINTNKIFAKNYKFTETNVTQGTAITSGVTLSSQVGSVLTVSSSLITGGSATFTVEHPRIESSSILLSNIINYSGTGSPSVRVNNITTGSASIVITNNSWISPLNAAIKLGYFIL